MNDAAACLITVVQYTSSSPSLDRLRAVEQQELLGIVVKEACPQCLLLAEIRCQALCWITISPTPLSEFSEVVMGHSA